VIGALERADWIARDADALRRALVDQARQGGHLWAAIRPRLRLRREPQAAHERYGQQPAGRR